MDTFKPFTLGNVCPACNRVALMTVKSLEVHGRWLVAQTKRECCDVPFSLIGVKPEQKQ